MLEILTLKDELLVIWNNPSKRNGWSEENDITKWGVEIS